MMTSASFQVVLSHAELAYLLTNFNVSPHLGVDRNPFDGLDDRQIAVAYTTARDALRARDLLRLDAADQPLVHDDLLRVLEVYANPHLVVTAYRYVAGEELPLAWFGYCSADVAVIHTRPGDLLHRFMVAPEMMILAQALADFCTNGTPATPVRASFILPGGVMAVARAYADVGQADQVAQVLRSAGLDAGAAQALAMELNNPAAVTAITLVATGADVRVQRRDAIYWQSTLPTTRFIVYTEGGVVQVSSGGSNDLLAILNEMV